MTDADRHYKQGCELRESGQTAAAADRFRAALRLDPQLAEAALALGRIYYDMGRSGDALGPLEQALQIDPDNTEALACCGQALADVGQTDLALQFLRQAVELAPEQTRYRLALMEALKGIEFNAAHPWYEHFLVQCFDDPRMPHAAIANAALSLLWVKPAVREAVSAEVLDTTLVVRLCDEPLLNRLLSKTVVRSRPFEEFYTRLRDFLARERNADFLELSASVAEQAFNSGYIQFQTAAEAEIEQHLLETENDELTPIELTTLASYRALIDTPNAARLATIAELPAPAERVVQRTLREPALERELQARIETLTPVDNAVSRSVQTQYEEFPYPRWFDIPSLEARPQRLAADIERHCPIFVDRGWPPHPRVLVPGCGTGYHPLSLARMHPEADILAVDLSRASLAYALRKQSELAIDNVRFRQADLLGLVDWTERFEYIDCAGVLHHMESPLEGWRVLTSLLAPGGVMRIGLYSELARRTIVAARAKIAALGITGTPHAIRQFREAMMTDPALEAFRGLARTAGDFFSMGEIRDLLFHVQEHRYTIARIGEHLDTLGLRFGGFLFANRNTARRFAAQYPSAEQWLDLDCWAAFEAQYPDTFYEMYQFYCLRR